MVRAFACPECGAMVAPARLGPGRQVRCGRCSTLLEVPFFPRTRRRAKRRPRWKTWASYGVPVAAALALVIGVVQLAGWARRSSFRVNSAKSALITRAQAEARGKALEPLDAQDPAAALRGYEALLERVRANPALGDLAERLQIERNKARERTAQADLKLARRKRDTADPAAATALCERVVQAVAALPPGRGVQLRTEALALATEVAASCGVMLEPIHGQFLLGSTGSYDAELHPLLATALRDHGYVPLEANSPLRDLWASRARLRLNLNVTENHGDEYLQSPNRISTIDGRIELSSAQQVVWYGNITARTPVPLPNIRAYEATRLALAAQRSPAVEQRFYLAARAAFRDKAVYRMRDMPLPGAPDPNRAPATAAMPVGR